MTGPDQPMRVARMITEQPNGSADFLLDCGHKVNARPTPHLRKQYQAGEVAQLACPHCPRVDPGPMLKGAVPATAEWHRPEQLVPVPPGVTYARPVAFIESPDGVTWPAADQPGVDEQLDRLLDHHEAKFDGLTALLAGELERGIDQDHARVDSLTRSAADHAAILGELRYRLGAL